MKTRSEIPFWTAPCCRGLSGQLARGRQYAVFFHHFSTFEGQRGLYLEDIFIQPDFRGKGIGKALLRHLARLALEQDCARFEWLVLDWNQPAMDFYRGLGGDTR